MYELRPIAIIFGSDLQAPAAAMTLSPIHMCSPPSNVGCWKRAKAAETSSAAFCNSERSVADNARDNHKYSADRDVGQKPFENVFQPLTVFTARFTELTY
ncbi:hypothetical protein [uncultured Anaerotruncus sp.]|uniref:hypothetical protein n=1 Tax=uncultured Anaerotruncus sp. TaxID=905011 RepID=UPI00280B3D90|nr:hypothetical protein [uncultured Anaerotruncus sp.]